MSTVKKTGKKRGQITKLQAVGLMQSTDSFEERVKDRVLALRPEFQAWMAVELADLRTRISEHDFEFALRSRAKHIATTFLRMESGEIKGLTTTGGFKL